MKYQYALDDSVFSLDSNDERSVKNAIRQVVSKMNCVSADLDYLKELMAKGTNCSYRIKDLIEELNHLNKVLADLEEFAQPQPW